MFIEIFLVLIWIMLCLIYERAMQINNHLRAALRIPSDKPAALQETVVAMHTQPARGEQYIPALDKDGKGISVAVDESDAVGDIMGQYK